MTMLKRVLDWLALTKTEKNVILFLIVTLLVGAGIRLYQETFPGVSQFDYHASDSTFVALSVGSEDSSRTVRDDTFGALNINTATKEQLMDLPGVGEVTAERIIQYRKEKGAFSTVNDLRAIKGISKKKLERLRPLITTQ